MKTLIFLFVILCLGMLFWHAEQVDSCEQRGGILVKGAVSYVCIDAKAIR